MQFVIGRCELTGQWLPRVEQPPFTPQALDSPFASPMPGTSVSSSASSAPESRMFSNLFEPPVTRPTPQALDNPFAPPWHRAPASSSASAVSEPPAPTQAGPAISPLARASVSSSASTVPDSPTLPLPLSRGDRETLSAIVATLQTAIDTLRAMEPLSHADLDDYRSAILDDLEYHVRRQTRRFQ